MDLITLGRLMLRRWAVVLPILLLTCVAGLIVLRQVGPTYSAFSSFSIVQRSPSIAPRLGGSLNGASAIMAQILNGDEVRNRVRDRGATAAFTVTVDDVSPLLHIEAQASSPDVALRTVEAVVEILDEELVARQEGSNVDEPGYVAADVLSRPTSTGSAGGTGDASYGASGTVLLVQRGSVSASGANPFGGLGGALAGVVIDLSRSGTFAARLEEAGAGDATFDLTPDMFGAPLIRVVTQAGGPTEAVEAIEAVRVALNAEIAAQQQVGDVAASSVSLQQVVTPRAQMVPGDMIKPLGAVGLAGFILAVSLAVILESIQGRRRTRDGPTDVALTDARVEQIIADDGESPEAVGASYVARARG